MVISFQSCTSGKAGGSLERVRYRQQHQTGMCRRKAAACRCCRHQALPVVDNPQSPDLQLMIFLSQILQCALGEQHVPQPPYSASFLKLSLQSPYCCPELLRLLRDALMHILQKGGQSLFYLPRLSSALTNGALDTFIIPVRGVSISSIRKIAPDTDIAQTNKTPRTVALMGASRPKPAKSMVSQNSRTTRKTVGSVCCVCSMITHRD